MTDKYDYRMVRTPRKNPHRCYITKNGKDIMSKSFPTIADAKVWGDARRYELQNNKPDASVKDKVIGKAFGDLADAYLTSSKDGGGLLGTTQHKSYVNWWADKLNSELLVTIDQFDIRKLLDIYMAEPCHRYCSATKTLVPHDRRRSPASRNRLLAALRRVYKFGQKENGWVSSAQISPAHQVDNLRENNERDRGLSEEQLQALLAACRPYNSTTGTGSKWARMFPFILGVATTGCRKNEWLQMEWDRVDLEAGTAFVPHTKNGEPKTLQLVPELVEELLAMRTGEERFRGGFLFASPTKANQPVDIRKAWNAAKKVIGMDGKMGEENYLRLHDLRHSVGFYLHQKGYTPLQIRDFLGHKKLQSTERYIRKDQQGIADIARDTMAGLGRV